jgi:hypothetical protein
METQERDWVTGVGGPCYASLAEMVAALNCDYDRLEELREARETGVEYDADANAAPDGPGYANDQEAWAGENPEDAEELAELEGAAGECKSIEDAAERIQEDALSVEVRSGWVTPGADMAPEDFAILLCTGGPAARIRGELDESGTPYRAWLEVQDWGKPWTQYFPADEGVLLAYARCFVFVG